MSMDLEQIVEHSQFLQFLNVNIILPIAAVATTVDGNASLSCTARGMEYGLQLDRPPAPAQVRSSVSSGNDDATHMNLTALPRNAAADELLRIGSSTFHTTTEK